MISNRHIYLEEEERNQEIAYIAAEREYLERLLMREIFTPPDSRKIKKVRKYYPNFKKFKTNNYVQAINRHSKKTNKHNNIK